MQIASMIVSCSLGIGVVNNGIIDVQMLIGATAAIRVAATAPSGANDSTIGTLSDVAHSSTPTETDDAATSPASPALNVTAAPFSATNGSNIEIDGASATVQNANKSWSLTSLDTHTLQFSVQSGDHWSSSGWSDLVDGRGAERSEISFSPNYEQGTQLNVAYRLTIEPGPANTASWLLVNQWHATTEGPPPFGVYMHGEHMKVILRYKTAGMTAYKEVVAYRDPSPVQRGHAYDMNVQVNFDPDGNGYLNVWRDGVQIVEYQGAIGMAGATYYWKEGIYRAPAAEPFTASFSNLDITTGSAPAPSTPMQPTTPTNTTRLRRGGPVVPQAMNPSDGN